MMRAFFIALSESRSLRHIAERSRMGQRMSSRFVAGTTVENALSATRAVNDAGMRVTLDNLGENTTNAEEARQSAALYRELLDQIHTRNLDANVSLKLTHMGLDIDPEIARSITSGLVSHAASIENFVRIDMEGSEYTQRTLDLVHALHRTPGNGGAVGAVIQAYLHRSESDIDQLCSQGIRVRLCKGAYKEPPAIAFQEKSKVDANFVHLMKILLRSGILHGIATHDEKMIDATIGFARSEGIAPDRFEFQMLYGIRRDLQEKLVRDGWGLRIYIPFGTEWYPYFMRRLAERPANAFFILKNLFRR
ncbi:MAG TPA: proline dehydrogenase family protein [Thermoanaerobaculia bacterium]|nr:proline dehydrogenase family protein [Thermoanaerobaculia bacterium]